MSSDVLNWPDWADRTPESERKSPTKFDKGWGQTKRDLKNLMEKMGVDRWYLEDVTGSHGDPGVVVRWEEDGVPHAVACDQYTQKGGNLREAFLWLKYERRQGRRPVETGQDQFAAAQLPSGDEEALAVGREPAHEVLDVAPDADPEIVKAAYRQKAKEADPDTGGSEESLKRVNAAKERMLE